MPRPKHTDPRFFIRDELERASGLPRRNMVYLRTKCLAPFHGQNNLQLGLYDQMQLAQLAVISSLHRGGLSFTSSNLIAEAFFNRNQGQEILNLGAIEKCEADNDSTVFELFCYHFHHADSLNFGETLADDGHLKIIDGSFVIQDKYIDQHLGTMKSESTDEFDFTPLGELFWSGRDKGTRFEDFSNQNSLASDISLAKRYWSYDVALRQASSVLDLNISKAIRLAFNEVCEIRQRKNGPHFYFKGNSS